MDTAGQRDSNSGSNDLDPPRHNLCATQVNSGATVPDSKLTCEVTELVRDMLSPILFSALDASQI